MTKDSGFPKDLDAAVQSEGEETTRRRTDAGKMHFDPRFGTVFPGLWIKRIRSELSKCSEWMATIAARECVRHVQRFLGARENQESCHAASETPDDAFEDIQKTMRHYYAFGLRRSAIREALESYIEEHREAVRDPETALSSPTGLTLYQAIQ